MNMKTCKTCDYWEKVDIQPYADAANEVCNTVKIFETRLCQEPDSHWRCGQPPTASDCYSLTGDEYGVLAWLCTAENFGCVKHSGYKHG
jgi:hypothetical protein